MVTATTQEPKRAEDLLIGTLAILALRGVDILRVTDSLFHDRFGAALEIFRGAGGELESLADNYYRDIVTETYDELDHSLIAAEQFGLIKFPNPSYNRLQITISPRTAHQILEGWGGDRQVFERAAEALYSNAH
jgi:hypothetical protein